MAQPTRAWILAATEVGDDNSGPLEVRDDRGAAIEDEVIVCVARAVASPSRLHRLSCLARDRQVNPKDLPEKLQMPANTVSARLRTLVTAGGLQRRKSFV